MEWISKAFISEQPEASFAACHAASCVKDEHGNIMIAYFAGSREGAQDVGIWLSSRLDGVWQAPRRIKYIYGLPHWNPILHRDGDRVLLYYKVGHSVRSWYTMVSESYDFGKSWTESREAIPGDYKSRVVTKNKILVTEDGRWPGIRWRARSPGTAALKFPAMADRCGRNIRSFLITAFRTPPGVRRITPA